MILEAGEKDLLPVTIRLSSGNEPRKLRYLSGTNGGPATYECLRFRCLLHTVRAGEGELNTEENDDIALGTYLFMAETEKSASGAGGEDSTDMLCFLLPLKEIGAVPGRHPFEVQLVTYNESAPGSAKSDDTETGAVTVLYGDGSHWLTVHEGVRG